MAGNSDWTHIRVRKTTAGRIRDRIDEMKREFYSGHQSRSPVDAGELSADALINWLLDDRQRHRERARRARGAGKPASASNGEAAPGPAEESGSV